MVASDRPAVLGGRPAFAERMRFVRPWVPSGEQIAELFTGIRDCRWLSNQGPEATTLERELGEALDVRHCAVVCNGTLGLTLALRALGIEGRVAVPAFTFAATAHAVTWAGCEPVFVDVEPLHWTIDTRSVEEAVVSKPGVEAVVGVHLFGNPCDTDGLAGVAGRHGVRIIYDAAHAFGTEVAGESLASLGDASVFSFHATKPFHTGEGGAVTSSRAAVVDKVSELRNFGFVRGADCDQVGLNAKLAEVPAGLGRLLLPHFREHMRRRNAVIKLYRAALQETAGVVTYQLRSGVTHNGSYCPVLVDEQVAGLSRDDLFQALLAENIETRPYFTPPLHAMTVYATAESRELPVAERLSRDVLCLPVYSDMSDDEARSVIRAVIRNVWAAREVSRTVRARTAGRTCS